MSAKKFVFRVIEKNNKIHSMIVKAFSRAEAWDKLIKENTMYDAKTIEIVTVQAA